jgi:beta-glucanase (GH16 family)
VNFTYGTVVVKAEFPGNPRTTWPAIWLLGAACQQPTYLTANGPNGGYNCPWPSDSSDAAEIDIAEGVTGSTTLMSESLHSTSGVTTCKTPVTSYSTNFHTYELDWSPGSLVFKIDGKTINCAMSGSAVPSHPMFLIIDSGIQTADLPQSLTVDYVHISH